MKIFLIILAIFLTSCKLNKVVNHHGIHNLEAKSQELLINQTNINQIKSLLGPPSSTSYFDENIFLCGLFIIDISLFVSIEVS